MLNKLKNLFFLISFIILVSCDEIQKEQLVDENLTLIYWPPNWGRPNWSHPFLPFHILNKNSDEIKNSKIDENSSKEKREINFSDPENAEIDDKKSSLQIPYWWNKFNYTRPYLPIISTHVKREIISDDSEVNEKKSKIYWPSVDQKAIDLTKRETADDSNVEIKEKIYWPWKERILPNIPFLPYQKFKREAEISVKNEPTESENPLTLEDLEIEEVREWWKKNLSKKPIYADPIAIFNGISSLEKREVPEIEPIAENEKVEVDEKGIVWPGNWWRPWRPLRPILVGKREAIDKKKNKRPKRQVIIIIRKQEEAALNAEK
ncbi:hypothetical protein PVAND_015058 [Polypedilum vanderplanki]|uniref:Uncharacterized protein n=1 Tax=Polypedilum vanderplanki TaxID=319348 RepID=A0A9J6BBI3_POLVA|nr:hypothetical protein PVAND_015058 [Polypedilum vanderplanki]